MHRLGAWLARTWFVWLALASFLVTACVPILGHTRFGDLSNNFTDHLHHAQATWMFFNRGLDVYRMTYGELWNLVDYPQKTYEWGHMPMAYPLGIFLFFAPTALLGKYVAMPYPTFGVVGVLYVLVFTHLALMAYWAALDELPKGIRAFTGAIAWLVLVRLGVQGFYDATWIGCGAMMTLAIVQKKPGRALLWFALAAFLHFRAAVLVPLAFLAFVQSLKRPWRTWPFTSISAAVASCVLAVWSFVMMYPATVQHRTTHLPVTAFLSTGMFWGVFIVSALSLLVALSLREYVLAATFLLGSLSAVQDFNGYVGFWHHASLLVVAPLVVGLERPSSRVAIGRQASMVWIFGLQVLVWGGTPLDLLSLLAEKFHPHW